MLFLVLADLSTAGCGAQSWLVLQRSSTKSSPSLGRQGHHHMGSGQRECSVSSKGPFQSRWGPENKYIYEKRSRELWSQQRRAFANPWDITGVQGLNSPQSSKGLQVRAPHIASHGIALSPALRPLLWSWAGGGGPNSVYWSYEFKDFSQDLCGGKLVSPKIQIPCDSLNRVNQEPQDLQELRASRAFMATPAPLAHRGTEELQVCLGCWARR